MGSTVAAAAVLAAGALLAAACGGAASGTGGPPDGRTVYVSAGCGGCHALEDAGATGRVASALDGKRLTAARVRDAIVKGRDGMPRYSSSLSDEEIRVVSAFVARASQARASAP
jgi:mono/diheme cytochrome c family protein